MEAPVVVLDYDPAWGRTFEEIAAGIRPVLAAHWRIEHVGSTAVVGLAAKPIIDLDVVVASADEVPAAVASLVELGYVHQGDQGIPGREAMRHPNPTPWHHLYVVVDRSPPYRDHVDLRDYLRQNPDAAQAYAAEKRRHAPLLATDRQAYQDAKAGVVETLLRDARAG